jgi:hypothetical protein
MKEYNKHERRSVRCDKLSRDWVMKKMKKVRAPKPRGLGGLGGLGGGRPSSGGRRVGSGKVRGVREAKAIKTLPEFRLGKKLPTGGGRGRRKGIGELV